MMRLLLDRMIAWTWALLWFALPLSMKGTVVILWAFGLLVLVSSLSRRTVFKGREVRLALLFILFFVWYLVSSLITPGNSIFKDLEKYIPLAVVPLLLLAAEQDRLRLGTWAIRGFFGGLLLSGLHMVIRALLISIDTGDFSVWMYHSFTAPYHLGAVYYSWYLSAAILYLAFRDSEPVIRKYRVVLLVFFLLLLLLSSSKMIIILTVPLLFWGILRKWAGIRNRKWLTATMVVLVLIGSIPFLERMKEIRETDLSVVRQSEYYYDTPFTGLSLRLVQWRFAYLIMQERSAWLTGTGPGNKQALLNEQYREFGVYTGNPDLGDTGYLDYNFHNQYIETLVGTGIFGFVILLLLLGFILADRNNKRVIPKAFFILSAFFFLTESVLERQAGIMLFCLAAFTMMLPENNSQSAYGSSSREQYTSAGTSRT